MATVLHNRRYAESVQIVEKLFATFDGVRLLSDTELSFYGRKFVQAWELPNLCDKSDYTIRLLLSAEFPYSPPRIAVWPAPPLLTWPHVENNGLLCLLSEPDMHSIGDPEAVVITLLDNAVKGLPQNNYYF